MAVDTDRLEPLRAAALAQPGGVERQGRNIKFQCPQCRADGHDAHQDNACLFPDGRWGCAVAQGDPAHWEAIGEALGARTRNGQQGGVTARETTEAVWPPPQPLPDDLPAVPPFEAERLLPPALVPWVCDIAERAQCPRDFVAVAAVVAAAAVIGRQLTIRPKQQDDWTVVPNLWGVAIGRPGIMKSPALEEAVRPLQRLVAEAREAHQTKMQAHEFDRTKAKLQKEVLEGKIKAALKEGGDVDELRAEYGDLEVARPTERRYLVNDPTVEKLGELLNENPNGLLLYRDELSGFLRTMDREGHENDRAFFCEAWNGSGPYTSDRIGRGTVHIKAACMSILGGMQPGPLCAYLREVFGRGASDDGFIQRFQLMVYPDVTTEWRNVDRWPDTEAKTKAFEIYRLLAQLDADDVGAHRETPDALPYLRFTPEAQAIFDTWRTGLEARLRAGIEHPVVVSHLAKYRSLMPALALLFHAVDCVHHGRGGPVSEEATARAEAWCAYLEAHAIRVYEHVTAGPKATAIQLAAKLTAGQLTGPFRARTVRLKGWTGLSDAEEIDGGLDLLEELGWIRRVQIPATAKGGRPTTEYHVNPGVIGGNPTGGGSGGSDGPPS